MTLFPLLLFDVGGGAQFLFPPPLSLPPNESRMLDLVHIGGHRKCKKVFLLPLSLFGFFAWNVLEESYLEIFFPVVDLWFSKLRVLYGNGSKRKRGGDCDRCSYTNEGRDDPLSMITLVNSQKEGRMRPTLFSRIPFFCTVIAAATLSSPEKKRLKKMKKKKVSRDLGNRCTWAQQRVCVTVPPFACQTKKRTAAHLNPDHFSSSSFPALLISFPIPLSCLGGQRCRRLVLWHRLNNIELILNLSACFWADCSSFDLIFLINIGTERTFPCLWQ